MPPSGSSRQNLLVEAPLEKLIYLRELQRQRADLRSYQDPTPGALARRLDATTVQTPALDLIDAALVDVADGRCDRLIISMPPQEGKSQRASRRFPTWLLMRNQDLRIAIASYEHRTARRWGKAIRDDLASHELLPVAQGSTAADEWTIEGHIGGVYSTGIGGALTGRPVDLLIIDDPVKGREEADSQTYRDRAWDWWTDTAAPRLAPGAPVVLILTRWHEDDLAGRLLAAEDGDRWRVLNIPAQADHDPNKGDTDPLGREPGEWLESARGRTAHQWEQIRTQVGSRTFTALYQGRPSPDSGDVLQRPWWRRYSTPLWTETVENGKPVRRVADANEVIQSWDMTFKDTKGTDYVVGQVWVRQGPRVYLVDQVRARLSFTNTLAAFEQLTAKWPDAHAKLVEEKANGAAVIDTLGKKIGGIVPINPKESKLARASAASPYVEAGNVWLPDADLARAIEVDVDGFIEEAAAFPNGTHDDQVDAFSQATQRLLIRAGQGSAFLEYWKGEIAAREDPGPHPVVQPETKSPSQLAIEKELARRERLRGLKRAAPTCEHRWRDGVCVMCGAAQ